MSPSWVTRLGLAAVFLSASCTAQTPTAPVVSSTAPAAKEFAKAAALYYSPARDGLDSFHCDAEFPWKDFVEKFSGQPIKADDPQLKALQAIRLSIDDQLHGKGSITVDTSALPDSMKAGAEQIKPGLEQSINGFFETWNPFMNGTIFTISSEKTKIEHNASGYRIWKEVGPNLAEAHFDNNLLMLDINTKMTSMATTMRTTFEDTPHGKILSKISGDYAMGTGAPQSVSMKVKYAEVSGFLIPSSLDLEASGVSFGFKFTGCTVKTLPKK